MLLSSPGRRHRADGIPPFNQRRIDPHGPRPAAERPSFSQSYNRYTYGFNNPLSGTDPSGFGFFDIAQDFLQLVGRNCAALRRMQLSYAQIAAMCCTSK